MSVRTDLQREQLMPLPSNRIEFWHQPDEGCFYVVEADAQFFIVRAAGPFPDSMTLGDALRTLEGPKLSASEIVDLERRATAFEIQEYRG
jgi:hypothetical protein